jgi:hypothetical protein
MMVRKGDYVFSHFYDLALVSVKLGILAFYWRVFVLPVFRTVVLATASFVIAWGIGITITLLLACRPLSAYWDANVVGKCLTMVNFVYFTNVSNLITDIWIFLLPIPMIWHLQLQMKKKLLLSFIFCIGLAQVFCLPQHIAELTHARTEHALYPPFASRSSSAAAAPTLHGTTSRWALTPSSSHSAASSAPTCPSSGTCCASAAP